MKKALSPSLLKQLALALLVSSTFGAHCRAAVAPVVAQKLENGTTLVTRADKIAPRVSISLFVRAGAADEKNATAGWRQVLTGAMLHSTNLPSGDGKSTVRTTDQWQNLAENWGGEFGATAGQDFIELWARGDSAFASQFLQSLLQIASTPRLADSDIAWARRRALRIVGQGETGVAQRATSAIAKALYRDESDITVAYALPEYGTFESLSNLSNEELRSQYASYFIPANIVVSAAGDVDVNALRSVLAGWKEFNAVGGKALAIPTFRSLEPADPIRLRERTAMDAWVFVAFRTPAPAKLPAADLAALKVLSAALDGHGDARLVRRFLSQDSASQNTQASKEAVQQTAAQWTVLRFAGELVLLAQTDPQSLTAVQAALLSEVAKLKNGLLTPGELQAAKNYARGSWATEREPLRERAFQAALPVIWESTFPDSETPQKIAAVTAADVQRVAQKYLTNHAAVWMTPG